MGHARRARCRCRGSRRSSAARSFAPVSIRGTELARRIHPRRPICALQSGHDRCRTGDRASDPRPGPAIPNTDLGPRRAAHRRHVELELTRLVAAHARWHRPDRHQTSPWRSCAWMGRGCDCRLKRAHGVASSSPRLSVGRQVRDAKSEEFTLGPPINLVLPAHLPFDRERHAVKVAMVGELPTEGVETEVPRLVPVTLKRSRVRYLLSLPLHPTRFRRASSLVKRDERRPFALGERAAVVRRRPRYEPRSRYALWWSPTSTGARAAISSSVNTEERMRKRTPSGASSEKPPPRPATTSTTRCVWDQYSN